MPSTCSAGRIASLIGMEGGHSIDNSLAALRMFHRLGARYMTLTHSANIDWADAGTDSVRHGGLTKFGEEVVREMNRLGMLVDLSHVSPGTMSDALNISEAPVIFSHSSARGVTDVPRNVPDDILRTLPAKDGVVMVTFVPGFVSSEVAAHSARANAETARLRAVAGATDESVAKAMEAWRAANPAPVATLAQVADHIDHIRKVAGIDHVGIGSDFDGISQTVKDLDNVSTYPRLTAEKERAMPTASANGTTINYTDTGGSGKPVVLLHAFPFNSAMWEPQLESLAEKFRFVVPDLKGFGESDAPEDRGSYSMDGYADDVKAVVDELGLDRLDRAVLGALVRSFGGGPVGVSTLAVAVGEEERGDDVQRCRRLGVGPARILEGVDHCRASSGPGGRDRALAGTRTHAWSNADVLLRYFDGDRLFVSLARGG